MEAMRIWRRIQRYAPFRRYSPFILRTGRTRRKTMKTAMQTLMKGVWNISMSFR
jgi:hypothetical protein